VNQGLTACCVPGRRRSNGEATTSGVHPALSASTWQFVQRFASTPLPMPKTTASSGVSQVISLAEQCGNVKHGQYQWSEGSMSSVHTSLQWYREIDSEADISSHRSRCGPLLQAYAETRGHALATLAVTLAALKEASQGDGKVGARLLRDVNINNLLLAIVSLKVCHTPLVHSLSELHYSVSIV